MKILANKLYSSIFGHLLFWIAVYLFYVYFFSYNASDTNYIVWFSGFLLPITMLTTYFVIYFLIPKYLILKKYFKFALYSLYTLIISAYLIILSIYFSLIFLSNLNIGAMPPMSKNYIFILILVYLIVFFSSTLKLFQIQFQTTSEHEKLKSEMLEKSLHFKEQEMNYLKKQIHPHFMFNALNVIYGFALKQDLKTPEIILKFSDLLDYILYQVDQKEVSIEKEIRHIENYIFLEKMRFQEQLEVRFEKEIENPDFPIPPMLLLPFIENSFKHGKFVNGILNIEIFLKLKENKLSFQIRNNRNVIQNETTGIGLQNIEKRLELLYPKQHSLDIFKNENIFEVNLNLKTIYEKA
ncbi:sensor histidine kinase [Aureivirga sp. CE67]|uniref:sensor histidine kinase n=1 Tax=Aureivirga sp. CE67 TaxID=1788983 RepID=UPI0018CB5148|nr:histidine kinase [Aureivirga sp. CE67]